MGNSASPLVACIVLNWNGWPQTERCLASLAESTYPATHVIVVDNGSADDPPPAVLAMLAAPYHGMLGTEGTTVGAWTPGTKGPMEETPTKVGEASIGTSVLDPCHGAKVPGQRWGTLVRSERNLGFTGGVNLGLRLALARGAEYVFLLNNDATVERACLSGLVEAAERHPDAGFVGPKILWSQHSRRIWSAGVSIDWARATIQEHRDQTDGRRFEGCHSAQALSGCTLLVRRAALERVGLLDERYFAYYEDVDWCLRGRSAGLNCLYVGDAEAYHEGSASANRGAGASQSAFVNYYGARNGLLFFAAHAPRRLRRQTLARFTARLLASEIRVIAGGVILRRPGAAARGGAIAAGIFDALRGRYGPRGRRLA